ncbi:MAG: 5-formyltetrahydrofolate cyclo-ligase [Candidatus Diapherotrites archaeon]|nr:5-formyltetrahydrofolate cyclo-ligase [Candidatus Diapherotrites archaeon]
MGTEEKRSISCGKKELRFALLSKRRKMTTQKVFSKGFRIAQNVLAMPQFQSARVIASYVDFDNEPPTRQILKHALSEGKKVCVPRRHEGKFVLSFHPIADLSELAVAEKGIMEPKAASARISAKKIDLVLVPGVAFDKKGNRLGFGSGYFDNTLPKMTNAFKVGLSFESFVLKKIPTEPQDVKMDALVAEKKIRFFTTKTD